MKKVLLALVTALTLVGCGEKEVSESQLIFERFGFDLTGITFVDQNPQPMNYDWSKIRFNDESEPGKSCTLEFRHDYWTHKAYCSKLSAANILDY